MSYDSESPLIPKVNSQVPSPATRTFGEGPSIQADGRRQHRSPTKKDPRACSTSDGDIHHSVPCPNPRCRKPISLLCPRCHQGYLNADPEAFLLYCDACHHMEHGVRCRCGTHINGAYVAEHMHHIRQLEQAADTGTLIAIILTTACTLSVVWLLVSL